MAEERLDEQTALTATPADGDLIHVVDVSDTTDNANGSSKKITRSNFLGRVEDETPSGTIDGSNAAFTLANTPRTTSAIKLYRQGVRQFEGVQYDMSGTTITFKAGKIPRTGNTLIADYEK